MSRYQKIKEWMDKSDWRMWATIGISIVMSILFLTDILIDSQIINSRDQVIASINREETAIKKSRMAAEERDNGVNAAFNHSFDQSNRLSEQVRKNSKKLHDLMSFVKEKNDAQ